MNLLKTTFLVMYNYQLNNYRYHPFTNNSIRFFSSSKDTSITSSSLISEVDLYHQPLHSPVVASIFLIIKTIIVSLSVWIHLKIVKKLKTDSSLVRDVVRTYSILQLFFWPSMLLYVDVLIAFVYPISDITGSWICHVFYFVFYGFGLHMLFHSFVVAVMR